VCKPKAILHDEKQYAIKFELCNSCGDCLPPCPTGAIDSWRQVEQPYSPEEQLGWGSLPEEHAPEPGGEAAEAAVGHGSMPDDVRRIVAEATRTAGNVPPPWSAAHPYVGLYSPERPAVAVVAGIHRLTDDDAESDIRHIVLDFGKTAFPTLEGQSIGVLPEGTDAAGRPHHVRLYSIASPRDGERPRHNNLSLTVKRVTADRDGKPLRGVASNWLCDLKKGDTVRVTGPYGQTFLMPNHPGAKLLMVCTGTGAAPMRAMTERRRRRLALKEGGEILLFFGARRPGELPYFGPLQKLPRDLVDVELAFSRVPNKPKEYVQDRIRARAQDVGRMLTDPDAFVFVCGLRKMEEGVLQAFAELAEKSGFVWQELFAKLRTEGRFHLESY
jgi:benzoyl-CoA 2,3-dioxygenase component A